MPTEKSPSEFDQQQPSQEQERSFELPAQRQEQPQQAETPTVDPRATLAHVQPPPSLSVRPVDPFVTEIEAILEDGLADTYQALDDVTKEEFRIQGEVTATAIAKILQGARVHARKIVKLIMGWLRIIPGMSRFFLEQEAKIKTDRLLGLRHDQKEDR